MIDRSGDYIKFENGEEDDDDADDDAKKSQLNDDDGIFIQNDVRRNENDNDIVNDDDTLMQNININMNINRNINQMSSFISGTQAINSPYLSQKNPKNPMGFRPHGSNIGGIPETFRQEPAPEPDERLNKKKLHEMEQKQPANQFILNRILKNLPLHTICKQNNININMLNIPYFKKLSNQYFKTDRNMNNLRYRALCTYFAQFYRDDVHDKFPGIFTETSRYHTCIEGIFRALSDNKITNLVGKSQNCWDLYIKKFWGGKPKPDKIDTDYFYSRLSMSYISDI